MKGCGRIQWQAGWTRAICDPTHNQLDATEKIIVLAAPSSCNMGFFVWFLGRLLIHLTWLISSGDSSVTSLTPLHPCYHCDAKFFVLYSMIT